MKKWILVLMLILAAGCGGATGGSEVGNPPAEARAVTGSVPVSGGAALVRAQVARCVADRALATNTSGQTVTVEIDSDCSFALELETGRAYSISFTKNDAFVASLFFTNSGSTLESPYFFIQSGNGAVQLGSISFSGRRCRPQNEPAGQNDRDGDGTNDLDDDDDDNDGTPDEQEGDCDLNGIPDDFEDERDCEGEDGEGRVIEARPHDNPNFEGEVDLDREVEIRFSCAVDASTVNGVTITVRAGGGSPISCNFDVSQDRVECEHEADPFLPDTVYTGRVDGVACANGDPITPASWSFRTAEDD